MTALVAMRIAGFVRGGRALAPLIAVLVELGVIYGGGASPAAVAYGYSAAALFPVLAWLTKLLLDTEPDVQRRLARLAVGPAREATAGLLTAVVLSLVVCVAAMAAPWLFHGIDTTEDLRSGIALGVLAHLLAVPPAVAVGALASRAVTGSVRLGVTVLVVATVLVVVLGLSGSFAPWLVPPVMATARELNEPGVPPAGTLLLLTAWAALWCAAAFAGYGQLRRSRA
jgi:HAMP domain-containing protein